MQVESLLDTADLLEENREFDRIVELIEKSHRIAIVVSYSGNNMKHTTMKVLPDLIEKDVPIVALTSDGDNLLRKKAKYTLTISSRERLYDKISTFSTETSILFIFNILFSCYFQKEYEENLRRKIQKGEKLEEPRMQRKENS